MVLDRETQLPVEFNLNVVQRKYADILTTEYQDMDGIREIILKARQQGFSSFILALFTVDFILRPYSISICISHRKDATELLFKKVKFYLDSYCQKHGFNVKDYLISDNKNMIESRVNNSMFYIGTAGTKVGGRGGSARNIHFSEAAFYQDTEQITAQEIILATAQQVPQGNGMIFIESTANGEGNYYQQEWERSNTFGKDGKRVSIYRPQFFGWQEFYTKEWVEEKRKEFPSDKLWKQEYPGDPDEAFITSGSPFFDVEYLDTMLKIKTVPVEYGRIMPDGLFA